MTATKNSPAADRVPYPWCSAQRGARASRRQDVSLVTLFARPLKTSSSDSGSLRPLSRSSAASGMAAGARLPIPRPQVTQACPLLSCAHVERALSPTDHNISLTSDDVLGGILLIRPWCGDFSREMSTCQPAGVTPRKVKANTVARDGPELAPREWAVPGDARAKNLLALPHGYHERGAVAGVSDSSGGAAARPGRLAFATA